MKKLYVSILITLSAPVAQITAAARRTTTVTPATSLPAPVKRAWEATATPSPMGAPAKTASSSSSSAQTTWAATPPPSSSSPDAGKERPKQKKTEQTKAVDLYDDNLHKNLHKLPHALQQLINAHTVLSPFNQAALMHKITYKAPISALASIVIGDTTYLAAGLTNKKLVLYRNGKYKKEITLSRQATALAFNPTNGHLAVKLLPSATGEEYIYFYDTPDLKEIKEGKLLFTNNTKYMNHVGNHYPKGRVHTLTFNETGTHLAAATNAQFAAWEGERMILERREMEEYHDPELNLEAHRPNEQFIPPQPCIQLSPEGNTLFIYSAQPRAFGTMAIAGTTPWVPKPLVIPRLYSVPQPSNPLLGRFSANKESFALCTLAQPNTMYHAPTQEMLNKSSVYKLFVQLPFACQELIHDFTQLPLCCKNPNKITITLDKEKSAVFKTLPPVFQTMLRQRVHKINTV